jgi:hypothetical protein
VAGSVGAAEASVGYLVDSTVGSSDPKVYSISLVDGEFSCEAAAYRNGSPQLPKPQPLNLGTDFQGTLTLDSCVPCFAMSGIYKRWL